MIKNKNLGLCKVCGKEISKNAKTCPNCGENKPVNKNSKTAKAIILIIFALFLINAFTSNTSTYSNSNSNSNYKSNSNTASKAKVYRNTQVKTNINPEDKIAKYAIFSITRKQYPNTYKKWGEKGVKKINSLMRPIAIHVAKSSTCDQVDMVELSNSRSIPPNEIVFFVDCKNQQRFYVNQNDLSNQSAATSKQDNMSYISDVTAITACEKELKEQLIIPLSMNRSMLNTNVYRATTGNIEVKFNFESKNKLGNILSYKARCIIDDQGIHSPIIYNR